MRLEGDRIILEKTSDILNKLQQRFSKISVSLADELVAERREEAKKEQGLSATGYQPETTGYDNG